MQDKFNLDSKLASFIPKVIEAFVKFYGEEERENITNKLNNGIYTAYLNIDSYNTLLINAKAKCVNNAIEYFFSLINIPNNEDNKRKYFGYSPLDLDNTPLGEFYNYYNSDERYHKIRVLNALKSITGNDLLTWDDPEEINKIKEELLKYHSAFNKAIELFKKEYHEKYGQYETYYNELKKLRESIYKKYNQMYLEYIMPYLSKHDQDILNSDKPFLYALEDKKLLINPSDSLRYTTYIEAFTSESERLINDANTKDFIKNSIIKDRISYLVYGTKKLLLIYPEPPDAAVLLLIFSATRFPPFGRFLPPDLSFQPPFSIYFLRSFSLSSKIFLFTASGGAILFFIPSRPACRHIAIAR